MLRKSRLIRTSHLVFLLPSPRMGNPIWLQRKKDPVCLLYLDGVQNPHNIGSILRTAAHFGIPYLLGQKEKLPRLTPSACRIAKGGAESVQLVYLDNPLQALAQLKKLGFSLIGTSGQGQNSLYPFSFPAKSIIAFGAESDGMGKPLLQIASHILHIPGTGVVESLNVSVAASLALGEYFRQHTGHL